MKTKIKTKIKIITIKNYDYENNASNPDGSCQV